MDKTGLSRLYKKALAAVDRAETPGAVREARAAALAAMEKLPPKRSCPAQGGPGGGGLLSCSSRRPIDIEEKLGNMGIEVVRHVWISEWLKVNIFLDFLRLRRREQAEKLARPHLSCFVGGHGQHSVGETVKAARDGLDGVVHVYPFTCTPEIVARGIMHKIAAKHGLPLACFSPWTNTRAKPVS